MDAWSLTAYILIDWGNVMLAGLIFSLIHFLNFKYYGTFTYITQISHSSAHLNHLQGIFSDKPVIIAEI